MHIVHVHVHVKPESVDAFVEATRANARQSVQEPGIDRFDVVQRKDDPCRFILVEAYRTPEDPALHKGTEHYKTWRATVAEMMAEPRSATVFGEVFPEQGGW